MTGRIFKQTKKKEVDKGEMKDKRRMMEGDICGEIRTNQEGGFEVEISEVRGGWYIEKTFEDRSGNVKQHVVVISKLSLMCVCPSVHEYVHVTSMSVSTPLLFWIT